MPICTICHFETELDDAAAGVAGSGRCICLRCYGRETGGARPMPRALRRVLVAVLEEVGMT